MLLKFIRVIPILVDILHVHRVIHSLVTVLLRLLLRMMLMLTVIVVPAADSLVDQVILLVEEESWRAHLITTNKIVLFLDDILSSI